MVYGQLHTRFAAWVDGHVFATALLYAAGVLAVGAALHYAVERPFLTWREPVRQRWAARRERAGTPSVSTLADRA